MYRISHWGKEFYLRSYPPSLWQWNDHMLRWLLSMDGCDLHGFRTVVCTWRKDAHVKPELAWLILDGCRPIYLFVFMFHWFLLEMDWDLPWCLCILQGNVGVYPQISEGLFFITRYYILTYIGHLKLFQTIVSALNPTLICLWVHWSKILWSKKGNRGPELSESQVKQRKEMVA